MSTPPILTRVLKAAMQRGASDVHAKAGDVFRARVGGELVPLTKQRLTPQQTRALAATFAGLALDDPQLDALHDLDCSWGITGVGRFRVNVLRQRSSFMVVLRVIPFSVPTPESLGIPEVVPTFVEAGGGLVVICGHGGSGKTSTVASLVHHINRSQERHVLTLEDPIEYLHRDLRGSITQREIGTDTGDLALGVRAALRQDADVLVISELRDGVAVDQALHAAESGRLVLVAVSAHDCAAGLTQLLVSLSSDDREIGRVRLASVLHAMVGQRLEIAPDGSRRVAFEWAEATEGVRQAILAGGERKAVQAALAQAMKAGRAELFQDPKR